MMFWFGLVFALSNLLPGYTAPTFSYERCIGDIYYDIRDVEVRDDGKTYMRPHVHMGFVMNYQADGPLQGRRFHYWIEGDNCVPHELDPSTDMVNMPVSEWRYR